MYSVHVGILVYHVLKYLISLSELGEYSPHILKSHRFVSAAAPSIMGKRHRSANSQGEMRLLQGFKLSC